MRSKGMGTLCGLAVLFLSLGQVAAQNPPPAAPPPAGGLQTGPASVPKHWSKYQYPESVPEGAKYHIIEKGDTLWDLAKRYLGSPFLWPQIWDQNKYVTDAHWIYPGDPLIIPVVTLVTPQAGEPEAPPAPTPAPTPAGPEAPPLFPATEEHTLQCAATLDEGHENQDLRIVGSEQGRGKIAFADRDILYLNKGSNAGLKAGDVYTTHHTGYTINHPKTGKKVGTKIVTTGWVRVILAEEASATVVVEMACQEIHADDYLKPFERVTVPLILRRPPPDRLTPPSGKAQGYVVDISEHRAIAASGDYVMIDLGSESGITPGSMLVVYRIVYPSVPTNRNVVGELAVLTVKGQTALAKVMFSRDAVSVGDRVELR